MILQRELLDDRIGAEARRAQGQAEEHNSRVGVVRPHESLERATRVAKS